MGIHGGKGPLVHSYEYTPTIALRTTSSQMCSVGRFNVCAYPQSKGDHDSPSLKSNKTRETQKHTYGRAPKISPMQLYPPYLGPERCVAQTSASTGKGCVAGGRRAKP